MTTQPTPTRANLCATYPTALARYEAHPTDPAAVRALGWVYAHLLKDASGQPQPTRLLRGLATVADFPMPTDEVRWRESVGWSVCRFLLRHRPETLAFGALIDLVRLGAAFVPAEPGLLRSVWWKALLRYKSFGLDWLGLFDALGWEGGFRPDDEEAEAYGDGKTARPLVEGLLGAVVKQLLHFVVVPADVAAEWLDRLAEIADRHPDWEYVPYYQAKLLVRLDRPAEAMAVFLPFARARRREFWVWSLLADLLTADAASEHIAACYARALTLGTPEGFLVKLRQRVAAWLIEHNRWADARAEIERLVATRQANGWPIPAVVQDWANVPAYTQAEATPLGSWYTPLLPAANALLWTDVPVVVGLVTALDPAGHYATVAIDEKTTGSFPLAKFGLRLSVGDSVALRYTTCEKKGRQVLQAETAERTEARPTYLTPTTTTGPLRLLPGKGVGFVGNAYVPAEVLAAAALPADILTVAEVVPAWDAVKQKVGLRAFRVTAKSVSLASQSEEGTN